MILQVYKWWYFIFTLLYLFVF